MFRSGEKAVYLVVRTAYPVVIIPNGAGFPILERAGSLLIFGVAFTGYGVFSTGDGAIYRGRGNVAGDLYSPYWAIAPEHGPFFTLEVILENAHPIFPAASILLNR